MNRDHLFFDGFGHDWASFVEGLSELARTLTANGGFAYVRPPDRLRPLAQRLVGEMGLDDHVELTDRAQGGC